MEQDNRQRLYDDYVKGFFDFDLAVSRTQLVALCASHAFRDFPEALPAQARKEIEETVARGVRKFVKGFRKILVKQDGDVDADSEEEGEVAKGSPYSAPLISLFFTGHFSSDPDSMLDFDYVLNSQQLVMSFAHLDAFLADTLRVVCRREPRLLRLQKTVKWQTVLDCGSYEGLIDRMVEEYAYEAGWQSLGDKVGFMREKVGLELEATADDVARLEMAENLRHVIIHNGGRASLQYLEKTRRQDIRVGELLPIDAHYVNEVGDKVRALALDVYTRVVVKFFGVSEESIFTPRLPTSDVRE